MGSRGAWERVAALLASVTFLAAWLAPASSAGGPLDAGGGFGNVLAVGQAETVNAIEFAPFLATGEPPPSFTSQLGMYTGLLYAGPQPALGDYFKPAGLDEPPGKVQTPRAGVRIVRDAHNVPHVFGTSSDRQQARADTMFGAGYASAEDRLFMMDVLRHLGRSRLTELIGPGTRDSNVRLDANQLLIADYDEKELQAMVDRLEESGAEGAQVVQDAEDYAAGVNQYISEARLDPSKLPVEYPALGKTPADWKVTDSAAVLAAIVDPNLKGGGREAEAAQVLRAAEAQFRSRAGRAVFEDFRRLDDPEAPVTTPTHFPFDDPGVADARAVAIPDLDSFVERDPIVSGAGASSAGAPALRLPTGQSNVLLVSAKRSASGRPLAVMGPQVGYFSPPVLMELALHGGGIDARGAAFPGISQYVTAGRGERFAWSGTASYTDNVDHFAEELCKPDGSEPTPESGHYLYKGSCRPFLTREHVLETGPTPANPTAPQRKITLKVERSVHGPIQGRATVDGKPVAIAAARSTYFHEPDAALAFKRLNENRVSDARSFQRVMELVNFPQSWFYVDDREIAFLQSGWFPRRATGTDPSLPTWGTGEFDWEGFMPFHSLPRDEDPPQGYLVNWNNKQAPGWRAADDRWIYGSVHRSQRLEKRLREVLERDGKIDLPGLVHVMEDAATVDLRGQEVYPWLRKVIGTGSEGELEQVKDALEALDSWERNGAHRRDLNRDNVYDESAAVAVMDAWWSPLVRAVFEPVLGRDLLESIRSMAGFGGRPPASGSAFFTGWWGYLEKDLRALLGSPVRGRLSRPYCGEGSLSACREILIRTLKDAAANLGKQVPATCAPGSPRGCDQIEFTAVGAVGLDPIPWQDRPGFQQVVEIP